MKYRAASADSAAQIWPNPAREANCRTVMLTASRPRLGFHLVPVPIDHVDQRAMIKACAGGWLTITSAPSGRAGTARAGLRPADIARAPLARSLYGPGQAAPVSRPGPASGRG
jgi:hypothetical protein